MNKWLCIILFFALLLRLGLAFYSLGFRENTDVLRYKDWARDGYLYGLASTYSSQHLTYGTWGNNQPPGSLYVLEGAYQLELQAAKVITKIRHEKPGDDLFVNGPLVTIFLRLPSILADIGIGALIYLIVLSIRQNLFKNNNLASRDLRLKIQDSRSKIPKSKIINHESIALLMSSLFLFNPVVIYNSAIWGQMDSVNNLFFVASLYFLTRKKIFLTILFVFLSLFIKFSLLFLVPFYLVLIWKLYGSLKKIILSTIISLGTVMVLSLPINMNPLWILGFVKNASGEMQNITAFALNFWWVIYKPVISFVSHVPYTFDFAEVRLHGSPDVMTRVMGISLLVISGLIFLLSIASPVVVFLKKKSVHTRDVISVCMIILLCGFLFFPRMHERYMFPVFAPFAIIIWQNNKYLFLYILLSILNFLNLYTVWHPFPLSFLPLNTLGNPQIQWGIAISTVLVGIDISVNTMRQLVRSDEK